jgi:hypothetical protein
LLARIALLFVHGCVGRSCELGRAVGEASFLQRVHGHFAMQTGESHGGSICYSHVEASGVIHEFSTLADAHADGAEFTALRHACQQLSRHVGKQSISQDIIDVACAAFHLGAAAGYGVDQSCVVEQLQPVVL